MRKNRALALLLVLVMTAGLLPAGALAAGPRDEPVELAAPGGDSLTELPALGSPEAAPDGAELLAGTAGGYSDNPEAYEIYPVPHSVNYGSGGAFTMTTDVNVVAGAGVDVHTTDFLREILTRFDRTMTTSAAQVSGKTNIVLAIDSTMAENTGTRGEGHYDPYTLTASNGNNVHGVITITGKDTDCVYYGLATLQMMCTSFNAEKFLNVTISDYSNTIFRGFIEGFYGGFDYAQRASQVRSIRDVKGNMYVFASKTDSYHGGANWDKSYPTDEANQIKDLIAVCDAMKVNYVWSLHIGKAGVLNGIDPSANTDANKQPIDETLYNQQLQKVLAKFESLYALGVRGFNILNDDYNSGTYRVQVKLLNDVNAWLKTKGDCMPLIYCCAGYNTSWAQGGYGGNGAELPALRDLDDDIYLYWTGSDVNSPITQENVTYPNTQSGQSVVTWLNYPCSEHCGGRGLFLGDISHYVKNADGLTGQYGLLSNAITSPEANKVAYFQLLSWAWNRDNYTSYMTQLWEDCFKYLQPEVYDAYLTIARNVSNCPNSSSISSFPESEYLKDSLDAVRAAIQAGGDLPAGDVTILQEEFDNILAAIATFRADCDNATLTAELEPWLKSLTDVATAAGKSFAALDALADHDDDAAQTAYNAAVAALETWDSYPSSNPNVTNNVKAGSLRLQPFAAALLDHVANVLTQGGDFEGNLARGRTVYVSGVEVERSANTTVPEKAVDGDRDTRWSGNYMKVQDGAVNGSNPSWIVVDLGEGVQSISSISAEYYNKVWPASYVIQAAGGDYTPADFSDANVGTVAASNAAFTGQHAKDASCWTTIKTYTDRTGSDHPTDTVTQEELAAVTLPQGTRYIRLYFTKINSAAGGHSIGLEELTVNGVRSAPSSVQNLALNKPATASSVANDRGPELAVDGVTGEPQWNSQDMKTSNTTESDSQTHQWLQVDLGATGSKIDRIKLWYNMKVWPMVYEIQTTDTPGDAASWQTVVRVARSPFNGAVKNGTGQNIADETGNTTANTAANTDTITTTSIPALQMTTIKRYVRFYVEKVNTAAPGNNVTLREIEIFGTNDALHPPVDVTALLASATADNVTASGRRVSLPAAPRGGTLTVAGSSLENVVANDGTIGGKNIGPREVQLLLRAWDNAAPDNYQQKNLTVTVPDHKSAYPTSWFPAVTNPNPKPEVIPAIQEWYGYNGSFTLTENSHIVINDVANVGLRKVADNMKADLLEITGLDLSIVEAPAGTASDIYIEALPMDSYDLGDEGYLLRVSDQGVKIYAPTYTGCLFGTITVEQILWQAADHASVPMGIMRDYPAYAIRGVKLDIARTPYRYQQLKDYAKIMLWYKMSEYDLHINDNDNANINGATMDTHSGFHRLESETFPSLAKSSGTKHAGIPSALVNADYYNNDPDYQGNPTYNKAQWRALTQMAQDYGMHLLTEIDLPAHSLVYNKYAQQNPDNVSWLTGGTMPTSSFTNNSGYLELLDLTGTNKDRALRLASELWDEYTRGSEPTIYGDIVHIGADEYWVHDTDTNNAFASFTDTMRTIIQGNLGADTKVRMWGASAGSGSFQTATTVLGKTHAELAEHYQLDVWHPSYENPAQRAKDGYGIVNCRDAFLYGNPGRTNRDVPNAEYLFNSWNPTMFGSNTDPLPGEPNLLGAKAVIWGDQSQEGMTELDIHQRVLRAIAILSEKTWGGATQSEGEFSDYELRFNRLAEGPGTQIAMNVDSGSSLVLAYDFKSNNMGGNGTVYDLSGNGYDGVFVGDGYRILDDQEELSLEQGTFLRTPIKTLSYPYTVSLTVKANSNSAQNAALFSGYDGRIQLKGSNGKLCANVNYFTRDFNYTVPTNDTQVTLTLVGTQQATRLYVDGQLVTFLSQKQDQDGVAAGNVQTLYSSVPLPLEKIGEGFQGQLSNLRVYNKALSAAEVTALVNGTDSGLVNVAQDAAAGGSSPQGANDNNVQRVCYAAKAVDGEEEELWSYWRADGSGNTLTVDLGESHPISRIEAQWKGTAPSFTLQTSADGSSWTAFTQNTAVDARYIKLTTGGAGDLAELLAYERVDKTALTAKLAEAERLLEPDSGFEQHEEGLPYAPVALARAVKENPLATNAEVAQAVRSLQNALDDLKYTNSAALSSLTLSAGTLRPAFSPEVLHYTASVANNVTQVTVTPVAAHRNAQIMIFCNNRLNTQNPNVAVLKEGANDIQVWVTASDQVTKQIYYLTLTRLTTGTPVEPDVPSGGGGGGGGSVPTETTKTEDRGDGATVTTVTKPDGSVTETVERPDGSKTEAVTAKDGAVTITATDANGEEIAKVELPAAIPAPETKFEDLDTVPWAEEAINAAAGLKLVTGIGNNKYDPISPMTRGALATVLHRLSQGKTDYAVTFKDVAQGKYYTEGVAWAAKVNVVKGISEDVFAPDNIITREQLAVMLARYAKLIGLDTRSSGKTLDQFADGSTTGPWALGSVAWCVEQGILKGKGADGLDPTAEVTRAEVAVMLDRFIALIK